VVEPVDPAVSDQAQLRSLIVQVSAPRVKDIEDQQQNRADYGGD